MMKIKAALPVLLTIILCAVLLSCSPAQPATEQPTPALSPAVPTIRAIVPTVAKPKATPVMPSITDVNWDPVSHFVSIDIDHWPRSWSPWTMYIDGTEISTAESGKAIVVRPNAPVDQGANGLIVGTLPWVSGLDATDFPCCGSIQFSVPDMGTTNSFDYNLLDMGCATSSVKVCKAEWTVHEGDWNITGTQTLENTKLLQRGNIHVRGGATLTLRNSELKFERGSTPTIHVYIFVDPGGTLIIDGSKVYPAPMDGGLTCVWNRGKTSIINSPTQIHYFDMGEGASLTMENSSMIYEIGGLLQVAGGNTKVSNSTVAALGLNVPAGGHLNVSGLPSGKTFEHWKVQDWIPEANYALTFDNVTVLNDDFTGGEYEHGPYERSWIFFLDRNSHVRLADAEVRKIFMDLRGDTSAFQRLRIGEPSSLEYRDIILKDVTANGEWSFTITDASATFTDSTYLFLQPSGSSNLKLVNSHMVEFIPRGFTGTITFENSTWTNAGEILGGVGYHSSSNNFRLAGSLKMSNELRTNLQWRDARVTREFEVLLTDAQGNPLNQGVIKFGGKEYATDAAGRAMVPIVFDESNYKAPALLEAWYAGTKIAQQSVDFFTETPIRLKSN